MPASRAPPDRPIDQQMRLLQAACPRDEESQRKICNQWKGVQIESRSRSAEVAKWDFRGENARFREFCGETASAGPKAVRSTSDGRGPVTRKGSG